MTGERMTEPTWAIVRTRSRCEGIAASDLSDAGYRAYVPRLRVVLLPHGRHRKATMTMRALFSGLVFVQDWRGWPERNTNPIRQAVGLMPGMRSGSYAALSGQDIAVLMDRERRGLYEANGAKRPPARGIVLRDDLELGERVEYEWIGKIVDATLDELSPDGRAIIRASILGRDVPLKVDAAELMKLSA